jgi:hypothetical protein
VVSVWFVRTERRSERRFFIMFPLLRRIIVPSLAVLGSLVAIPSVAHADVVVHGPVRVSERERIERERARERIERERIERERVERQREEHRLVCARAHASGASWWRLREMNCAVR